MTPALEKHVANLERNGEYLLNLARLYVDKYPPASTPKEVLQAVTIPVPLPVFLSLLVVAFQHDFNQPEQH